MRGKRVPPTPEKMGRERTAQAICRLCAVDPDVARVVLPIIHQITQALDVNTEWMVERVNQLIEEKTNGQ